MNWCERTLCSSRPSLSNGACGYATWCDIMSLGDGMSITVVFVDHSKKEFILLETAPAKIWLGVRSMSPFFIRGCEASIKGPS